MRKTPKKSPTSYETEFFRLAGWYLACRLQVYGGVALGSKHRPNLSYDLLGMVDHQNELRLLVAELATSHMGPDLNR